MLNCFGNNFVNRAPILVIFFSFVIRNDLHTNLSIFSTLPKTLLPYFSELVNMGIISNVTNLTRQVGNTVKMWWETL